MKTYPALACEFKDRPGVYISSDEGETQNISDAFLYIRKDGLTPDIAECLERAKTDEENHKKYLNSRFEKVEVNNYQPYTWLEHCNLVEVEISEDTFNLIMEGE